MPIDNVIDLPKISMEFYVETKDGPRVVYTFEGEMPQEQQDAFAQLVGNGLARVSIGIPMDRKVFGNGAGAHVSLSLTCNQDAGTIAAAYSLAGQAVVHYVKQHLAQAVAEFNQVVSQIQPPQS